MKNIKIVSILLLIISCNSVKKNIENIDLGYSKERVHFKNFNITKAPFVVKKDTFYYNELRFFRVKSAKMGILMMYKIMEDGRRKKMVSTKVILINLFGEMLIF